MFGSFSFSGVIIILLFYFGSIPIIYPSLYKYLLIKSILRRYSYGLLYQR